MPSTKSYYEGINHVIEVSSESGSFSKEVNRNIEICGYKLLHIGTQTTGPKEAPEHDTVAILGKKLTKKEKENLHSKKTPNKFKPSEPPKK